MSGTIPSSLEQGQFYILPAGLRNTLHKICHRAAAYMLHFFFSVSALFPYYYILSMTRSAHCVLRAQRSKRSFNNVEEITFPA
jgi:hypothetical protein